MSTHATGQVVRSHIPARLDRLPWSPFHTRIVLALGVAWLLDGLEITVASAIAETLTEPTTLGLSSAAVGLSATIYLLGEVVGAPYFGRLSDRLGRRKLFMITMAVYLGGSGLTALTLGSGPGWIAFFYVTRFIAGMGIGGEYGAINSVIDELIPARHRGRVDLAVNRNLLAGISSRYLGHAHPAEHARSRAGVAPGAGFLLPAPLHGGAESGKAAPSAAAEECGCMPARCTRLSAAASFSAPGFGPAAYSAPGFGPAAYSAPGFRPAAYSAPGFGAPPRTRLRFRRVGSNICWSPDHESGAQWIAKHPNRPAGLLALGSALR